MEGGEPHITEAFRHLELNILEEPLWSLFHETLYVEIALVEVELHLFSESDPSWKDENNLDDSTCHLPLIHGQDIWDDIVSGQHGNMEEDDDHWNNEIERHLDFHPRVRALNFRAFVRQSVFVVVHVLNHEELISKLNASVNHSHSNHGCRKHWY